MNYIDLIAYLNQHLSAEEQAKVKAWINASTENRLAFERFRVIWQAKVEVEAPASNKAKAWKEVQQRIKAKTKIRSLQWMRRAAAVLLLVLLAYTGYYLWDQSQWQTYTTLDSNVNELVELADGTKIWLNKNSVLRYPKSFSLKERRVELEGEAFFEVERAEQHPFVIETDATEVKVLGTSFLVQAYTNSSFQKVAVSSGLVAFYDKTQTETAVNLRQGQGAIFTKNNQRLSSINEAEPTQLAWHTGRLEFKETALKEVFSVLENHFDITINIDSQIEKCILNASLSAVDQEEALSIIANLYDLKISSTDNSQYTISGPGCE